MVISALESLSLTLRKCFLLILGALWSKTKVSYENNDIKAPQVCEMQPITCLDGRQNRRKTLDGAWHGGQSQV